MSECRLPSGRAVLDWEDEMSLPKGESRGTLLLALHEAMECLRNSNMTRAELMQQVEGLERERNAYRAVLCGAGYQNLETTGQLSPAAAFQVGKITADVNRERLAAQPAAVEPVGELIYRNGLPEVAWLVDPLPENLFRLYGAPPAQPAAVEPVEVEPFMYVLMNAGDVMDWALKKEDLDPRESDDDTLVELFTAPPAQALKKEAE